MANELPIPHNGKSVAIKALMSFDRWVTWRYVERKDGKLDKPPFRTNAPSSLASVSDPGSWTSFEEAISHAQQTGDGVGFVMSPGDDGFNLVAFDADDCRDPTTGDLADWARQLVNEADSYTEITPSGKGLRILGHGNDEELHTDLHRPDGGHIEVYSKAIRYITVTGQRLGGTPDELGDLAGLVRRFKEERE